MLGQPSATGDQHGSEFLCAAWCQPGGDARTALQQGIGWVTSADGAQGYIKGIFLQLVLQLSHHLAKVPSSKYTGHEERWA